MDEQSDTSVPPRAVFGVPSRRTDPTSYLLPPTSTGTLLAHETEKRRKRYFRCFAYHATPPRPCPMLTVGWYSHASVPLYALTILALNAPSLLELLHYSLPVLLPPQKLQRAEY